MLCDELEGWEMGGRSKRERVYVFMEPIHVVVQQKLTQHFKQLYSKLKINFKTREK